MEVKRGPNPDKVKKIKEAKQYLKDNNPSNINSMPALRERVKKLEIALGIYDWIE